MDFMKTKIDIALNVVLLVFYAKINLHAYYAKKFQMQVFKDTFQMMEDVYAHQDSMMTNNKTNNNAIYVMVNVKHVAEIKIQIAYLAIQTNLEI